MRRRGRKGEAAACSPLPGEMGLGGYYGHYQGHWLSATAFLFGGGATRNETVRAAAALNVETLAAVMEQWRLKYGEDGYLFPYDPLVWDQLLAGLGAGPYYTVPFYTLHKLMAGLLDQWEFAGDAKAFEMVKKMAAWVRGRVEATLASGGEELWQRVPAGRVGRHERRPLPPLRAHPRPLAPLRRPALQLVRLHGVPRRRRRRALVAAVPARKLPPPFGRRARARPRAHGERHRRAHRRGLPRRRGLQPLLRDRRLQLGRVLAGPPGPRRLPRRPDPGELHAVQRPQGRAEGVPLVRGRRARRLLREGRPQRHRRQPGPPRRGRGGHFVHLHAAARGPQLQALGQVRLRVPLLLGDPQRGLLEALRLGLLRLLLLLLLRRRPVALREPVCLRGRPAAHPGSPGGLCRAEGSVSHAPDRDLEAHCPRGRGVLNDDPRPRVVGPRREHREGQRGLCCLAGKQRRQQRRPRARLLREAAEGVG